jgi:hypothetical protein
MTGAILHGYWRSTASYRVRIALNLKGVAYDQRTHDLRKGEQRSEAYRALLARTPVVGVYDDHDSGTNDGDRFVRAGMRRRCENTWRCPSSQDKPRAQWAGAAIMRSMLQRRVGQTVGICRLVQPRVGRLIVTDARS